MSNPFLNNFSKEQLIELIGIYSKNWLAMDGVWFQSIEEKLGMEQAMEHDASAWARFTVIEAKKIKQFLGLSENPGIEGLEKALQLRFYSNINKNEIFIDNNMLIYRNVECRVQNARVRKGLEMHPCKQVGIIEYSGFAKTIDSRFSCECLSCYPEILDNSCACSWKFTLE